MSPITRISWGKDRNSNDSALEAETMEVHVPANYTIPMAFAALLIGGVSLGPVLPAHAAESVAVTLADKGMDSMRMDRSMQQVKAGKITFTVTNTSHDGLIHEFVVAKSDKPLDSLPYNEKEM